MDNEAWAGLGVIATAVAGGIAVIIKAWRSPKDEVEAKALPPGQKPVTHADLEAIRSELTSLVRVAEEACEDQVTEIRTAADKNARELLDKVHGLALKVERLIAAHEERGGQRSRRGGSR
ncbi:hypothetical protein WMF38_57215 [Sorangium sp. So ce118]